MTTQRLSGARLNDIREPLSWTFNDSIVVIENGDQPIPADVVEALLADRSTPVRIEATWHLDEKAGTLHLSEIMADEERCDKEVAIPIRPAGHVRMNLGTRQYNVFRGSVKH